MLAFKIQCASHDVVITRFGHVFSLCEIETLPGGFFPKWYLLEPGTSERGQSVFTQSQDVARP